MRPATITTWTKHGWITIPANEQDIRRSAKIHRPYGSNHRESSDRVPTYFSPIDTVTDAIQAGIPNLEIDKLPPSIRRMYQETERFFMTNNAIMISNSPEEAAKDNDYGSFQEESDAVVEEMKKLEDSGLVVWEEKFNENEVRSALYEEQIRQRDLIIDEYSGLIEDAEEYGDQQAADIYALRCVEELRELPDEKQLTYRLNSQFTGKGYTSPKKKYRLVERRFESDFSAYADARRQLFEELFYDISFCRTKKEIWGVPENHEDGSVTFTGGIAGRLHELYFEDKALREKWNEEAKVKAERDFIHEWRAAFISDPKLNGKPNPLKDEESLVQNLYFRFRRVSKPEKMTIVGKKVVVEDKRKPSFWDQDKQKAFCKLNLTLDQWSAIYRMRDIVLARIKLNTVSTPEREHALAILRDEFRKVETLYGLQMYVRMAKKRTWIKKLNGNPVEFTKQVKLADGSVVDAIGKHYLYKDTCEFKPSLIDQISIDDEIRWEAAVRAKGKALCKEVEEEEEEEC